jgi:Zn-dependent peptidase ImmA (M78 family)
MSKTVKKQIRVGGHDYNVVETNLDGVREGKDLLGMHDVKANRIFIDENMTHSRKVETFMHEIIHVIYTNAGAIDALSNGLLQLGVADYLWKKVK